MTGAERVSMAGLDERVTTAENYRRFALEAAPRSPAYGRLAHAVSADEVVLAFLTRLPPASRQPNLLLAAARHLLGEPAGAATLRTLVEQRGDALAAVMTSRRTQTNEAARCATLLPALATLTPPLALLEVGASAGLTLLPDLYAYAYDHDEEGLGTSTVPGRDPLAPTIRCALTGPAPLPDRTPEVVWRAGLDLNPLDAHDEADVHWLECLLWPGEVDRLQRLHDAAATARRARPPLHRGDLLDDLADVAAGAPEDATLVVFHTAVLAYVEPTKRAAFGAAVSDLGATWLSNEAPGVVTGTEQGPEDEEGFVLLRDGREVLARTDPHGTWVHWIAGDRSA